MHRITGPNPSVPASTTDTLLPPRATTADGPPINESTATRCDCEHVRCTTHLLRACPKDVVHVESFYGFTAHLCDDCYAVARARSGAGLRPGSPMLDLEHERESRLPVAQPDPILSPPREPLLRPADPRFCYCASPIGALNDPAWDGTCRRCGQLVDLDGVEGDRHLALEAEASSATSAARGTAAVSSPAGLGAGGHDRLPEGVPAGRPSSGWVRPRHVGPGDLIGALIKDAYEEGNTIHLSLKGREGRSFHVTVMSDPEGNGPGSLHVSDSQLATFLGSLGGL